MINNNVRLPPHHYHQMTHPAGVFEDSSNSLCYYVVSYNKLNGFNFLIEIIKAKKSKKVLILGIFFSHPQPATISNRIPPLAQICRGIYQHI